MDELLNIVSRVLKVDRLKINMSVTRDNLPEWDSLAHIKLICELEEELGIKIPIEAIPSIYKLEDFLKYIGV